MKSSVKAQAIAAAALLNLPGPWVATIQAQDKQGSLDEVIVTARRREEALQDVPVAVTALSGEQLAQQGVQQLADLRLRAPALTISASPGGNAIPAFTIRSQRQGEGLLTQDLSVALYQDEVVQARPHGLNQAFFDVASVQVLKGPQGTLFGRNSTGGAVLIQPNHPTDEFGGEVGVEIGNYDRRNAQGMLNVPFSDTVFFRIAADRTKDDGYTKNLRDGKRHNDVDSKAARVSLTWKPNDQFETYTSGQYVKTHDGGSLQTPIYAFPFNPFAPPSGEGFYSFFLNGVNPNPACIGSLGGTNPGGVCNYDTRIYANDVAAQQERDPYHVYSNLDPYSKVERRSVTNITTYTAGDITFKNVMGYIDIDYEGLVDYDATLSVGLQSLFTNDMEQFSEEFQMLGSSEQLDWIVGLYYFNEKGTDITLSSALDVFPASVTNPFYSGGSMENTGYSIFAQGTWNLDGLHEGMSLTTGARYTIDKREMRLYHTNPFGCRIVDENGAQLSPCSKSVDKTFREPTWTVSLEQKLNDDSLAYLAHRRGYRSGGFNNRAEVPAQFEPFDPEFVDDVELGYKTQWNSGDVAARLNVAAFYQWYSDIQRTLSFTSPSGSIGSNIQNAAKAHVYGGELEFMLQPTRGLELTLFYAMSIARFDKFVDPLQGDLSDFKFQGAPDHTGGAVVRYTLPLSSTIGEVTAQADYFISSAYQFVDQNHPLAQEDGFDLLGFRLEWNDILGTKLDASAYVKNALDEEYWSSGVSIASLGAITGYVGAPRTYGVGLRYQF